MKRVKVDGNYVSFYSHTFNGKTQSFPVFENDKRFILIGLNFKQTAIHFGASIEITERFINRISSFVATSKPLIFHIEKCDGKITMLIGIDTKIHNKKELNFMNIADKMDSAYPLLLNRTINFVFSRMLESKRISHLKGADTAEMYTENIIGVLNKIKEECKI